MQSKTFITFTIAGLLAASVVHARDFVGGTIAAVRPDNFDVGGIFIKLAGTISGTATCTLPDGGANNWYFISKSNPLMKELLSAALSAKMSEKSVTIVGNGTCTQGYEDVRYIQIN